MYHLLISHSRGGKFKGIGTKKNKQKTRHCLTHTGKGEKSNKRGGVDGLNVSLLFIVKLVIWQDHSNGVVGFGGMWRHK